MIQTAFVLGAGLGTRLKSLTAHRPKPLIPVANRPLITYTFDHLLGAGVGRLIVNTHWRSEAYARLFPEPVYRGVPIRFREEQPEVLETAGGIWNVRDLLGPETFFVYNGDILSDLPLESAVQTHREMGNEVTMVLRSSGGPLQVAFDEKSGRVTDIGDCVDAAAGPRFLFSGIYLVNGEFVARIPAATKISVVPIFCDMIRSGARLGGVVIDEGCWWDLGNRENYLDVHKSLATPQSAPWIHPTAQIAPSAIVCGATAIGAGARIGAEARVSDSLIWDGAEIASFTVLDRCIVTDGQRVEGSHSHADI
ncbi:MAG TPA: sugar phosphate nucleotidyltransferase [Chthoniobacter sp.]